jgi:hypothetical protein
LNTLFNTQLVMQGHGDVYRSSHHIFLKKVIA